jgi:hypothetical protein
MLHIIDPNVPDPRPAIELQEGRLTILFRVEMAPEDYEDDIHLAFREDCPKEFRMFEADEVSFAITADEARRMAQLLQNAADESDVIRGKFPGKEEQV